MVAFRPQLRTLLLLVNVVVLLLPVGGITLLKMYESELVRQTESALIGQGALLAASYSKALGKQAHTQQTDLEFSVLLPADSLFHSFAPLTPIRPRLDVASDSILPPSPRGVITQQQASDINRQIGTDLQSILKDAQKITLCGIRLLDSNGIVVASSGSELGLSLSHRLEVNRALKGYYASVLRKRVSDEPTPTFSSLSRKGWVRVLVAMPVIHDQKVVGAVLLSRSPVGIGKGLYLIRKHLLMVGLTMLTLVILLTWLTTALISRPLKKLVQQTRSVQQGGGTLAILKHPGTQEVDELSKAISGMAGSLQTRADYIQNFARHVSHEFKTPITSLQGSIELMQDMAQEMTAEEQQHFLANMEQDTKYLDKLTQGLLELARADMSNTGEAHCNPVAILNDLTTHYQTANKQLIISHPKSPISVAMKGDFFRGVMVNLVDNSFKHGKAHRVTVAVSAQNKKEVTLEIQDDGVGISATNRDKIFTPFFTTARNRGGTGLGLAITKALLDGHGGIIKLMDNDDKGTGFSITLPQ